MKFRDRNYILDKDGNILKIVGDYHSSFITSYIKYYQEQNGLKKFNGKNYMTNTQVFKSYHLLAQKPSAIRFINTFGCVVTGRERKDISQVFDAREKLQMIRKDTSYTKQPIGEKLLTLLGILEKVVDSNNLGITGSFLTGMEDAESDMDFVCYGRETYELLHEFIRTSNEIERYEGKRFIKLAERRISHMPTVTMDVLRIQEGRKLQALFQGTHFNIQPLRLNHPQPLIDVEFVDIGDVAIMAHVTDDEEGIYAPAFYKINSVTILEGFVAPEVKDNLQYVISFVGAYSQILKKGECFYAKGTLLRGVQGNTVFYALSIDPWNRGLDNKIQLVR